MRLALDTNRYVDFCRGDESIVNAVRAARDIILPFVTLAELRAGFACGMRSQANAAVLTRFINRPRVGVLFADDGTTRQYANLFRQLRQQGTPIPVNDLWIAALCVQHDLILASRDCHFDLLPQIPRA